MNGEEFDRPLVDKVRLLLDESVAQTDPGIRLRLRRARQAALDAAEEAVPWYVRIPRWVTAGGLATAVVLLVSVSIWMTSGRQNSSVPTAQVEDVEILTGKEQLDLYRDLEFYEWLERSDHAG